MTKPDQPEDERDDLDEDEEEEEDESPPPPKAKSKAPAVKAGSASSKAPPPAAASRALVIGVVALAIGGAAGWFGHIQKTKAALRAEVSAAPAGSGVPAGPCGAWQSKICTSTGEQSAACQQAKAAAGLLVPSTCETALGAVPETLAKVKAARASCDKLVTRLCKDLPPDSKTCGMVKERTPSFPSERCDQMLLNYDKVIGELKQMDQQQAGMPGGAPMGAPPGMHPGVPPGMPPGGPHITMPATPAHP